MSDPLQITLRPFPPLPLELIGIIVEQAADCDKNTSSSLSLVSKKLSKWSDPYLFRDLSLRKPALFLEFKRRILSRGAEKYVLTFIYAGHPSSSDDICDILQLFPNLTSLALYSTLLLGNAPLSPKLLNSTFPSLRRLFFIPTDIDFSAPFFRSITHLDLSLLCENKWSVLEEGKLCEMPNLTHLALAGPNVAEEGLFFEIDVCHRVIPPSAQVLLLDLDRLPEWTEDYHRLEELCAGEVDERLVVTVTEDGSDGAGPDILELEGLIITPTVADEAPWNGEVAYEDSYWHRATQIVENRKKRKELSTNEANT